ncbi:MAG: RNA-binding protein [Bryobacterales bacterium]
MRTLFIANLDKKTTEDDVRKVFEPHGEIDYVQIAHDPNTGLSRGVAFVRMIDPKRAAGIPKVMTGTLIDGRTVRVSLMTRNH